VRRIDLLGLALLAAQAKHGERNLILAVRRQSPYGRCLQLPGWAYGNTVRK
jgi:hypothetical protein